LGAIGDVGARGGARGGRGMGDERRRERMQEIGDRRLRRIIERETRMSGDKEQVRQRLNDIIDGIEPVV